MTIAIGFTYMDKTGSGDPYPVVVLATDSRLSTPQTTTVQNNSPKVFDAKFADNFAAIVAISGNVTAGTRFVDRFRELAPGTQVTSARVPANIAEDAMRTVRTALLKDWPGNPSERINDHATKVLLGYAFNGASYLYEIDLGPCIATKARTQFITMGCAASLADFLLTDVDFKRLNQEKRTDTAIAIIELCKFHDNACGGPTQLGIIDSEFGATIHPNASLWVKGKGPKDRHAFYMNVLFKKLIRFAERPQ